MNDIDKILAAAAKISPDEYFAQSIKATRQLHDRFQTSSKLSGVVYGENIAKIRELLSVSLLINDRTFVKYRGEEMKINLFQPETYSAAFGTNNIIFNIEEDFLIKNSINPKNPNLIPGFCYSAGKEMRPLMLALSNFIEEGAIIFQPTRAITAKREGKIDGRNVWALISANENKPLDDWQPENETSISKPLPVKLNHSNSLGSEIFEITMPFVKGVPFRDLHAMLTDETDLIASFRSTLKTVIRDAHKTGLNTHEIVNDVINPKIDVIGRKLKSLHRIHRLKVGGAALGSIGLACTAVATGGIGGGLLATASAGGFGLLANQYSDYLSKRDEIQNDPFYLLWRCRRVSRNF